MKDNLMAMHQNWVQIDTVALANNVRVLKSNVAITDLDWENGFHTLHYDPVPPVMLLAVVKANAYGHGIQAAPCMRDAGANAFGVTTLDEALALKEVGIDTHTTPILLFAPLTVPAEARVAVEHGFHVTVCDDEQLALIEAAEAKTGTPAYPHLKVNTGMGRLGLDTESAQLLAGMRQKWAGAYTHFARAAERDLAPTRSAWNRFRGFLNRCEKNGVDLGVKHCANSAAALRLPEARLDMVRIGTLLYGQMPTSFAARPQGLSDRTFQAQARVVFVHDLKPGETVGYGSEFTARRTMRAAVLPIGFADGFGVAPTSLYRGWRGVRQILADRKNPPYVLLGGRRAPALGRVAMQMIVVDVTGFSPEVKMGDVADVPMRRLSANKMPFEYIA